MVWQSDSCTPGKSSHPGHVLSASLVELLLIPVGFFPNSRYLIFLSTCSVTKMNLLGQVGSSVLSHRQHNRSGMFYTSLLGVNIHSPTAQSIRSLLIKGWKHVKHKQRQALLRNSYAVHQIWVTAARPLICPA